MSESAQYRLHTKLLEAAELMPKQIDFTAATARLYEKHLADLDT